MKPWQPGGVIETVAERLWQRETVAERPWQGDRGRETVAERPWQGDRGGNRENLAE